MVSRFRPKSSPTLFRPRTAVYGGGLATCFLAPNCSSLLLSLAACRSTWKLALFFFFFLFFLFWLWPWLCERSGSSNLRQKSGRRFTSADFAFARWTMVTLTQTHSESGRRFIDRPDHLFADIALINTSRKCCNLLPPVARPDHWLQIHRAAHESVANRFPLSSVLSLGHD